MRQAGMGLRGLVDDVEGGVVLRVGEGHVLLNVSSDPPIGVLGSAAAVAADMTEQIRHHSSAAAQQSRR
jgi:hypothetical protein